ncbi:sialidase family protein [Shinella sp.]|uniref:sialidase family protein n=1 Tax=Shinella sp. TaxID=1870904 RepID=UPI00403733DA
MARFASNPVYLASPEKGVDGRGILTGARAPLMTDGRIGDFWLDSRTDQQKLYGPKNAGAWPDLGFIKGNRGWTPVFAAVADGVRRVQRVVDWQGGEGPKPATGKYVGATGLVDAIGDALDIRGPEGPEMVIDALDAGGDTATYDTLVPAADAGDDNVRRPLKEMFSPGGSLIFKTLADAQAAAVPARIDRVFINEIDGYRVRVDSQPSAGGKHRSADRFLSDEQGTDSANGGWWADLADVGPNRISAAAQAALDIAAARVAAAVEYPVVTGANFTASSDVQVLLSTANVNDYWHFGSMVYETAKNRLHWMFRSAAVHTAAESQIMYMFSDDGGATLWSYDGDGVLVSGPSAVVASPAGRDYRDVCLGITPTGDILAIYTDLPIGGGATPVRRMRSRDSGKTWQSESVIYTHSSTGARAYGRIKVVPGDGKSRMVFTMYRSDTNDVRLWLSDDMGATWTMGAALFSGSAENETEVAFWGNVGVAIGRKNAGGMSVAVTENYGATWTKLADVLGSVTADVAPTVDIVRDPYGTVWVVLGTCSRANDTMRWFSGTLKDVLANGGDGLDSFFDSATDMQATSGYHVPQRLPSGEWVVFEVKEDNSGGRVLRLRRMQIEKSVMMARKWTPRLVSGSVMSALGNEATYTSQFGRYDRLGDLIRFEGYLQIATKGTLADANNPRLTMPGAGVPSGSQLVLRPAVFVPHFSNGNLPAGNYLSGAQALNGQGTAALYRSGPTGSTAMVVTEINATFAVRFSGSYYAAVTN